ncbi:AMP-binding protein [Kordia sp.]|uniref:AMP-binding protein n=1 Tax=Kordia sp. TaxID=1965332 RepID=UPI003B593A23
MEVKINEYASLFEIYYKNSLNHPEDIYIAHDKVDYTYAECTNIIEQTTVYLQNKLQKDRPVVGLAFTDQFKFIISFWACTKLEADIVLVQKPNARSGKIELETLNITVDIILSDDNFELNDHGKIDSITTSEESHFKASTKNNELQGSIYFFTSGTTGKSKFIKTTYYQIVNAINCIQEEKRMPYTKNQRVLITAPLFHSYGLSCLIEYTAGDSQILLPPTKKYLNPIQCLFNKNISTKVSAIEGVPYFYQQLLLFIKRIQMPNLRHIGMGGDVVSQELLDTFHTKTDSVTFSIRYGITEIPSVISINYFTYSSDFKPHQLGEILSIYTINIEKEKDDASQGELSIEHFYLPDVKKKINTGDIFEQKADKFSFISRNTFIKYRGYKINPIEIETYLRTHVAVDDCRVILINDTLTAEIVTTDTDLNLGVVKEYLKEELRDYVSPDRVKIVESIKRTKTGKIIRH